MTGGYDVVYEDVARSFQIDAAGRVHHRLAGIRVPPQRFLPGSDAWTAWAGNSIWPVIYRWHYLGQTHEQPVIEDFRQLYEAEDPAFVMGLSAANRSPGFIDGGWTVTGKHEDDLLCEKQGIRLRVNAGSIETENQAVRLHASVTVRFPSERRYALRNYYFVSGGHLGLTDLRVYFHIRPHCAPWLLDTVTAYMAQAGASYSLKILNNPASFTRPDAAVLYMPQSDFEHAKAITRLAAGANTKAFRSSVPALTRKISAGIAVADEPGDLDGRKYSFGEHRSRLLARGLISAATERVHRQADIVAVLRDALLHEGVDPKRPFSSGAKSLAAEFI